MLRGGREVKMPPVVPFENSPLSCENCKASEKSGLEMRERLEELNRRMQPNLLKREIHREIVEGFDSRPSELLAGAPISSPQREKKAG
jgi:hypothetical protein